MDLETIKTLFNYGTPVAILALSALGAYRLMLKAGVFLAPIIQSLAAKHIESMTALKTVGEGLLEQQRSQTELMKRHDTVLTDQNVKITEIHQRVVGNNSNH